AGLCVVIGAYLHIRSRRAARALPDDAQLLEEALELARAGDTVAASGLFTQALRLNPKLWQAYQYRGELAIAASDLASALEDLSTAIRLQPAEPHLYTLRAQVHDLLGDPGSARRDREIASR